MASLGLSAADRILEIGNYFFNVQNIDYSGSYDLEYENSNSEMINKVFIETDNGFNSIILTLILFFKGLVLKPHGAGVGNIDTSHLRSHNAETFAVKYTYSYQKQSASQTIRNNVRNRLLNTINEDVEKYRSSIKTNENRRVVTKRKNQFINQIEEVDSSDDLTNESIEYIDFFNNIYEKLLKLKTRIYSLISIK